MLSDEDIVELKKDIALLKTSLYDFNEHPEEYTTPEYTTSDGHVICIINSNDYVATGVILHGRFKGYVNTFKWNELTPIATNKITEEDPYGEEQWENDNMKKRIKRFRNFIQ